MMNVPFLVLVFGTILNSAYAYSPNTCSRCQNTKSCKPPQCVCCSDDMPLPYKENPQMVFFTFDDAITPQVAGFYRQLFDSSRRNPNGCPVSMTLFISHSNTVYSLVREFYQKGMEIASHSVSHGHPKASTFKDEANKQKQNLARMARIPHTRIRGWRSPFLEPLGDAQPNMLQDLGYAYDATLTISKKTLNEKPPVPFTLDFGWPYDCKIKPCPKQRHRGFWEVPVISLMDYLQRFDCVYVDGCNNPPPDEEAAFRFLWDNFQSYYKTNRAPFGVNMHASWFFYPDRLKAMDRFIQELVNLDDVYIISVKQVIDWLRNPVNLQNIKTFQPWGCTSANATKTKSQTAFDLRNKQIEKRLKELRRQRFEEQEREFLQKHRTWEIQQAVKKAARKYSMNHGIGHGGSSKYVYGRPSQSNTPLKRTSSAMTWQQMLMAHARKQHMTLSHKLTPNSNRQTQSWNIQWKKKSQFLDPFTNNRMVRPVSKNSDPRRKEIMLKEQRRIREQQRIAAEQRQNGKNKEETNNSHTKRGVSKTLHQEKFILKANNGHSLRKPILLQNDATGAQQKKQNTKSTQNRKQIQGKHQAAPQPYHFQTKLSSNVSLNQSPRNDIPSTNTLASIAHVRKVVKQPSTDMKINKTFSLPRKNAKSAVFMNKKVPTQHHFKTKIGPINKLVYKQKKASLIRQPVMQETLQKSVHKQRITPRKINKDIFHNVKTLQKSPNKQQKQQSNVNNMQKTTERKYIKIKGNDRSPSITLVGNSWNLFNISGSKMKLPWKNWIMQNVKEEKGKQKRTNSHSGILHKSDFKNIEKQSIRPKNELKEKNITSKSSVIFSTKPPYESENRTSAITQSTVSKTNVTKTVEKDIKTPSNEHIEKTPEFPGNECQQDINCFMPNCFCQTNENSFKMEINEIPQIVYLAIQGELNFLSYSKMRSLFKSQRINPNGCPIGSTFFISGQGSSYSLARNLHRYGTEIAMNGMKKSGYSDVKSLKEDLDSQMKRIDKIIRDTGKTLTGWRSPTLTVIDNNYFEIFENKSIYDSSIVLDSSMRSWPFTLDFGLEKHCYDISSCQFGKHAKIWEVPIIPMSRDNNSESCVHADDCSIQPKTTDDTFKYLLYNFEKYYYGNRAPFGIHLSQKWFHWSNNKNLAGLSKFIDSILSRNDVYVVSITDMIKWMQEPSKISDISKSDIWRC